MLVHFDGGLGCFFLNSFSQSYTQGVDEKLQLLDKNELTTGILYDRVYPLANLTVFNQTEADTSYVTHFYQAYGELQTARDKSRCNGKNGVFGLFFTEKPQD